MKKLKLDDVAKVIGIAAQDWHKNCHSISLAIVKAGLVPGGRVARGLCQGVLSQHSWIAIGDPYNPKTKIVDPTLWTYREDIEGIWHGAGAKKMHLPHGAGSIWKWGRPVSGNGKPIRFDTSGMSRIASSFLDMLGPLDHQGWASLLSTAPVEGWPAREILEWAYQKEELTSLIPMDHLGMLTDINPGGLYF